MRVLIVSQYFWPETFGITALARSLKERGVEVTVLTGKPNYPEGRIYKGYSAWGIRREVFRGVEVIRLPLLPRGIRSPIRMALNYLSFVVSGTLIAPWLLLGRRFDVVLVYAPSPLLQALPAILLAWIKNAPLAVWVQDLWPESLSATGFIKSQAVLSHVADVVRFIYRHTDRVLVPSEAFRAPIAELTRGTADIHYFPNAWTEEPATDTADASVEQLANDIASGFSVVFAGNLGSAQALDTVTAAAEILQKSGSGVRFFLVGSGSHHSWVKEEIARVGLHNVFLPGRLSPSTMPRLYSAASTLLVSLRDEPIFAYTVPSKLQGYLAAGRPIIAALNGEGARVVDVAKAGFSCPAGDAGKLAEAIRLMSELNPDARIEMGENARRYALANFSLDRLTTDLIEQLQEMVTVHARETRETHR